MHIFRISEYLLIFRHHAPKVSYQMKETLVVSSRGQITLPVRLRKRLGIKGGDVVILEDI